MKDRNGEEIKVGSLCVIVTNDKENECNGKKCKVKKFSTERPESEVMVNDDMSDADFYEMKWTFSRWCRSNELVVVG